MLYAVCGGGSMPRIETRAILTDLLDKAKADAQGVEVTFAVLIEHRAEHNEAHATVVEWCRENGVPVDVWVAPGETVTNPVYNNADGLYDDRSWVDLVQAFAAVDPTEVLALFVDPYEQADADNTLYEWLTAIISTGIVCRAFNAQMFQLENDEEVTETPVAPEEVDLAAAQEKVLEVIAGPVFGADPDAEVGEVAQLREQLAQLPEAPAPSYIEKFSAGELSEDDLRQLSAQDLRDLCKAVGAEPESWRAKDHLVAALVALWGEPEPEAEPVLAAVEEPEVSNVVLMPGTGPVPGAEDGDVLDDVSRAMEHYTTLDDDTDDTIGDLGALSAQLGWAIVASTVPCRERQIALDRLEEAFMWAVKALHRHGLPPQS